MTSGRTVLILKDPSKGTVPSNYRPITCLPILWKLLTAIIARNLNDHLETESLIGEEQKGCRAGMRGTKDHLLLDKYILQDCKRRKTSLANVWIDYQKAYDMVPHDWILKSLELVRANNETIALLRHTMKQWNTELQYNGQKLTSVDINRGIFQGDTLSPLLFIITLIPLSIILRKCKKVTILRMKTCTYM